MVLAVDDMMKSFVIFVTLEIVVVFRHHAQKERAPEVLIALVWSAVTTNNFVSILSGKAIVCPTESLSENYSFQATRNSLFGIKKLVKSCHSRATSIFSGRNLNKYFHRFLEKFGGPSVPFKHRRDVLSSTGN